MLYDLTFLEQGKPWPPKQEIKRIKQYDANRRLFEGEHFDQQDDAARRVQQVIGAFDDVISYEILLNYQQLVSKKTADLLFSEWPTITSKDERMQKFIDEFTTRSHLLSQCYQVALDISRYGDGTMGVSRPEEGAIAYAGRTDCWYPVVDPMNIKRHLHEVIATVVVPNAEKPTERELLIEIHSPGRNERRRHRLEGVSNGLIGPALLPPDVTITGLPGIDFWQVSNVATSDRVHGIDDYHDINALIQEIEVRFAQISKVLDKHAQPSMQGPMSALVEDPPESGEYKMRTGNYFVTQEGGDEKAGTVSYVVWDAQMSSAFEQIEKLLGQLRTISEMGALISDVSEKMGQMPTGTALRTLLSTALAKIARVRMTFDAVLKQVIQAAAQLEGIKPADVSIKWFDGLPDDPLETAQIISSRTGGKQTMSVKTSIMETDGKTEEEAKSEVLQIQEENAAAFELVTLDDTGGGDDE
ncbi:phage portal protein [Christensenellaceae bacterium OttesenSCG-928-L17]|nr:phage portal protein [Christensenellaceae bacterium OttesenSCG-928-L17]